MAVTLQICVELRSTHLQFYLPVFVRLFVFGLQKPNGNHGIMLIVSTGRSGRCALVVTLALLAANISGSTSSKKFMKGLIIGTILGEYTAD